MKISVITCTWNSMAYLEQSINSVLLQSYKNIEYIFVDGGSTDGTLERIAEVKGDVKVLHNVRGGIANAMNKGIEAATGDIIAHLHSDDYYLNDQTLATVISVFEKNENTKWLFGRVMFDDDGVVTSQTYVMPKYSYHKLLMRNFIPHPATFIRKEVFQKCGYFNLELKYAMDYGFWLRISKKYEPIQIENCLSVFRRHSGSTTHANYIKSFNEDFNVRLKATPIYLLPEVLARYLYRRINFYIKGIR
jgi:glycosyltransferase involved in cell wall biosynthesis